LPEKGKEVQGDRGKVLAGVPLITSILYFSWKKILWSPTLSFIESATK